MTKLERIIITFRPIAFLLRKTKRWYLPGFEGVPLYDVLKFFQKQIRTVSLTERAAAVAYNFVMAIPPSLLFLFTLIPNLPFIDKRMLAIQLHLLIRQIIPNPTYNAGVIKFIDSFISGSKIALLSSGFLLALFFASNAVMGLMRSFNKNYVGFEKRKGLQKRWMAIKLTTLLFGLVFLSFLLLIMQGEVLKWLGVKNASVRGLLVWIRWVLIVALIFYSIAFIYKYAPAVEKRWKLISPGTILATTLSLLASWGFASFVNNFGRYNALYEGIGTIIVMMSLIFINSLVIIIGFELNVSIKTLRAHADQRKTDEEKQKILQPII